MAVLVLAVHFGIWGVFTFSGDYVSIFWGGYNFLGMMPSIQFYGITKISFLDIFFHFWNCSHIPKWTASTSTASFNNYWLTHCGAIPGGELVGAAAAYHLGAGLPAGCLCGVLGIADVPRLGYSDCVQILILTESTLSSVDTRVGLAHVISCQETIIKMRLKCSR